MPDSAQGTPAGQPVRGQAAVGFRLPLLLTETTSRRRRRRRGRRRPGGFYSLTQAVAATTRGGRPARVTARTTEASALTQGERGPRGPCGPRSRHNESR